MNIFAMAIITTNPNLRDILVSNLSLEKIEGELDIYSKKNTDYNTILICSNDVEKSVKYLNENYDLLKIAYIWNWEVFCNTDLKLWDIVVPNTILNRENQAFFIEESVSWNYDLNKFWLMLNGICLTLWENISEDEIIDIKEESAADIVDRELFFVANEINKVDKIDKFSAVIIIWTEEEYLKNGANILELMF